MVNRDTVQNYEFNIKNPSCRLDTNWQELSSQLSSEAINRLEQLGFPQLLPEDFQLKQIVETHISLVLIGNEQVFKLKKPLRLSFVDHSTIESRWKSSVNEICLNRRLTKDTYLGLRTITTTGIGSSLSDLIKSPSVDELHIGIEDVVVVMRTLPDETSLKARIANDEDSLESLIKLFASKIANFHKAQVHSARKNTIHYSHNLAMEQITDNLKEVRGLLGEHEDTFSNIFEDIAAYTNEFLEEHAQLIKSRALHGLFIEGHGDLRCEHLYLYEGELKILDCVEFSKKLRFGDILSDCAFLKMDLDFLGRSDLSEILLDEYQVQLAKDFSKKLLIFYAIYRALVRAKVSLLKYKQVEDNSYLVKAHNYISLASRYLRGVNTPFVLMVGGYMGVGKSTLARQLAKQLYSQVIRSDEVRKDLFEEAKSGGVKDEFSSGSYTEGKTTATYEKMLELARRDIKQGLPVILDATFSKAKQRKKVYEFCRRQSIPCYYVKCELDIESLKKRISERGAAANDISDGRLELLDAHIENYQLPQATKENYISVDASLPIERQSETVISRLKKTELKPN